LLCCCGQATPLAARCTEVFDALLADRVDPVEYNLLGLLREAIGNTLEFGKYCTSRAQQFERIANPAKHAVATHTTSDRANGTTSNAYSRMQKLLWARRRSHPDGDRDKSMGDHEDRKVRGEITGWNSKDRLPPNIDPSVGDWHCESCGNWNWARRDTCNKCKAPKPAGQMAPPARGTKRGSSSMSNSRGPRSDWAGNHQEQSRKQPCSRSRERQEADQGPQDWQPCRQLEKSQTKVEVGPVEKEEKAD